MPCSPSTPDQLAGKTVKALDGVSLSEKQTKQSFTKSQASLHEPSPASTYGDTATGDSVPVTPLEPQAY
ncbi:hypothetical protein L228DRAFT_285196, partial [Xylona heveae TC161]